MAFHCVRGFLCVTVGGVAACGCVWLGECLHVGRCEPVGGCVTEVCKSDPVWQEGVCLYEMSVCVRETVRECVYVYV